MWFWSWLLPLRLFWFSFSLFEGSNPTGSDRDHSVVRFYLFVLKELIYSLFALVMFMFLFIWGRSPSIDLMGWSTHLHPQSPTSPEDEKFAQQPSAVHVFTCTSLNCDWIIYNYHAFLWQNPPFFPYITYIYPFSWPISGDSTGEVAEGLVAFWGWRALRGDWVRAYWWGLWMVNNMVIYVINRILINIC